VTILIVHLTIFLIIFTRLLVFREQYAVPPLDRHGEILFFVNNKTYKME